MQTSFYTAIFSSAITLPVPPGAKLCLLTASSCLIRCDLSRSFSQLFTRFMDDSYIPGDDQIGESTGSPSMARLRWRRMRQCCLLTAATFKWSKRKAEYDAGEVKEDLNIRQLTTTQKDGRSCAAAHLKPGRSRSSG